MTKSLMMLIVFTLGGGQGAVGAIVRAPESTSAARAVAFRAVQLGRSDDGRPIIAIRAGDQQGPRVLVVGCIHGTEFAGIAVARALARSHAHVDLWIVPNLNPDGYARGTRQNGRGVDLNANWSSQWRGGGRPWGVYYPGPHPFSERETRIARNLILRIRPRATVWFHQHMNVVWAWGPSSRAGRIYARAAGMRSYHHHWLAGTAANWQNHHLPGSASFTVELPAGTLSPRQVRRQVRAVLALAASFPSSGHAHRVLAAPRAPWIISAERLIGRLPLSFSVAVGGRVLYAHAGGVSRPPASNEKLLLSMALLDRFGTGFRIPTTVEGPSPAKGSVAGDLWLVGHGDPELNDAAIERLARNLRAAGVRAVHGSVIGVTNTFTRERWAPGWHRIALQFVALPTALTIDANRGPVGFIFDPERRGAAALTADLRALGVRVNGNPGARAERPATEPVLATIRSAPLVDILRRQNFDSMNLDAEVLTKMLGAAVFDPPGSIAKGARAIQDWSIRHGAADVAHDGSGLSYTNRVSTNGVIRLLSEATSKPWGRALRSILPTADQGTLTGRLRGIHLRAKTGTLLQHVSALSGWVWLQRSRRWAEFSILSRGLSKPQAVTLEDELVATMATQA